jgi:hypothetical protein
MKYEVNETSPRHKETMHIIHVISKALGIHVKKLTGSTRHRELVDARRICYVLLKEKMQLPAIVIGSYFNRDHASILHHLNSHEMLYKTYFDYRVRFDKAEQRLKNNEYVENDMYECINNMLIRIETLEKQFKKL